MVLPQRKKNDAATDNTAVLGPKGRVKVVGETVAVFKKIQISNYAV
jgi:hypothetical protein